jgi:UDP-N-acetylglucosamine transferase subunit ALG13
MKLMYGTTPDTLIVDADIHQLAVAIDIARHNRAKVLNPHAKTAIHAHLQALLAETTKRIPNSDTIQLNQYRP